MCVYIYCITVIYVQVKVEMVLIEGDNVAKAIIEHVGNLNIRKVVVGISRSNLR